MTNTSNRKIAMNNLILLALYVLVLVVVWCMTHIGNSELDIASGFVVLLVVDVFLLAGFGVFLYFEGPRSSSFTQNLKHYGASFFVAFFVHIAFFALIPIFLLLSMIPIIVLVLLLSLFSTQRSAK